MKANKLSHFRVVFDELDEVFSYLFCIFIFFNWAQIVYNILRNSQSEYETSDSQSNDAADCQKQAREHGVLHTETK